MALGLDVFFHLLLASHHQLSHFLHVKVRNFGLLAIRSYLLYFVRKKN